MKFSDLKFEPHRLSRDVETHPESVFDEFRNITAARVNFPNGYGASILNGDCFNSERDISYELAVMEVADPVEGTLYGPIYDTPITDDVLGYLTPEQVEEVLAQIEALPPVDYKPI